ncbi:MAG TPA: heterodisulfide reductase-related iron-sulfur binding cluster [Acidimicrobiales bacterium]|jgi:Fe-S oxidoreductase|nr:heterodisulfide reductase-related iron-sulfur binding cluster [Acidimicrobiales bacterium]
MTTTYDPAHPRYFDEPDLRQELERVYDLCHGCRLCFNLCPAFPSLFDMIDNHDGDVGAMSPAEQDRVVDECYQCKLCYVKCPYVPPHEWNLDFPRLMMRAHATRQSNGKTSTREKVTDNALGRTDLIGVLSTTAAPVANAMIGTPGSLARKAMEATVGIHADRLLPPYARERFTTWFKKRDAPAVEAPRGEVSLFSTCFIEYMEPEIGKDAVGVLEHNQVACGVSKGTKCCGAPFLHQGEVARFQKSARRNVAALAREVRAGRDIVVAQPTCGYVIKRDYPIYVPGPDADLVSSHTFDAAEYLVDLHRTGGGLDLEFPGEVPEDVTYHASCHMRAQHVGNRGQELMALTGAKVTAVERCSGIDGTWGYRKENYEMAKKVAKPLIRAIESAPGNGVCGDCHLANTAIREETGDMPLHPVQFLARAYGFGSASGAAR